jgi:rod shape-determining protein MreC
MKSANYRLVFVFFLLGFLLLIFDRWRVLQPVRYVFQLITSPIEYELYSIKLGLSDSASSLVFWKSGEARIKNLEQKNWELTAQLVGLRDLQKENKTLRDQLGLSRQVSANLAIARVLGSGHGLEIGLGEKDGVEIGMTVVYAGSLVGRVEKVLPISAVVELPTDAGSTIPVDLGPTHAVAIGQFGSGIILEKVAQTDQVNIGDLVETSGEGGSYISGLMVGKVSKISGNRTDLFRQVQVEPAILYGQLDNVFVVMDK